MERYWCLRWLLQEGEQQTTARVLREGLVRLERVPLVLRIPALPPLDRGTRVSIEIEKTDLFEAEARARFIEALSELSELGPIENADSALEEGGVAE